MSCSRFEKLIALYAGDDLPERKARRVQAHLSACASCRRLAEELSASQSALKALRGETVEEALLLRTRQRVLARLAAQRPERLRVAWRWACALPAGLMVGLGAWMFLGRGPAPAPVPHQEPAQAPRAQVSRLAESAPRPAIRTAFPSRRAVRPVARPPAAPQPLLVKLITDDPSVVIYWLIETKGE